MNPETALKADLLIAFGSRPGLRLFNNPVGEAWQGKVVARDAATITLLHPRRIAYGLCPGSSDVIGWHSVVVTPDMVGSTVAVFTAPEIKTDTGRVRDDQRRFLKAATGAGAKAGIVRNAADLHSLVYGGLL